MKFTAFHLMSYPYLPDDFTKKHRSVWVDIPRDLDDPKLGDRIYNDYYLDQLEFADSLGFDGIGVNEHHQNAYGLMPSPNIMAATLAAAQPGMPIWSSWAIRSRSTTHRYESPKNSATLDVISGGRLVAGFPVGTALETNYCYGEVPATLREKYREAHDLILRAWTEPEVFDFTEVYQAALRQFVAKAATAAASADCIPVVADWSKLVFLRGSRLPIQLPLFFGDTLAKRSPTATGR